ncbi:MAG: hypothetical protein OXU74_06570 [Gemmatimonadota bacterium]|nr:hypothetical protein [Gemmatimonadota bacterium]
MGDTTTDRPFTHADALALMREWLADGPLTLAQIDERITERARNDHRVSYPDKAERAFSRIVQYDGPEAQQEAYSLMLESGPPEDYRELFPVLYHRHIECLLVQARDECRDEADARAVDRILAGEPLDPVKLKEEVRGYGHSLERLLEIAGQWKETASRYAATYGREHFHTRQARQHAAAFRLVAAEIDVGAVYGQK